MTQRKGAETILSHSVSHFSRTPLIIMLSVVSSAAMVRAAAQAAAPVGYQAIRRGFAAFAESAAPLDSTNVRLPAPMGRSLVAEDAGLCNGDRFASRLMETQKAFLPGL